MANQNPRTAREKLAHLPLHNTPEVLDLGTLRDSVGPRVQVKAAGRFKEAEEIAAAFAAGATHVATFLTSELIGGAAAIVTGGHLEPLAVGATVSRR